MTPPQKIYPHKPYFHGGNTGFFREKLIAPYTAGVAGGNEKEKSG